MYITWKLECWVYTIIIKTMSAYLTWWIPFSSHIKGFRIQPWLQTMSCAADDKSYNLTETTICHWDGLLLSEPGKTHFSWSSCSVNNLESDRVVCDIISNDLVTSASNRFFIPWNHRTESPWKLNLNIFKHTVYNLNIKQLFQSVTQHNKSNVRNYTSVGGERLLFLFLSFTTWMFDTGSIPSPSANPQTTNTTTPALHQRWHCPPFRFSYYVTLWTKLTLTLTHSSDSKPAGTTRLQRTV